MKILLIEADEDVQERLWRFIREELDRNGVRDLDIILSCSLGDGKALERLHHYSVVVIGDIIPRGRSEYSEESDDLRRFTAYLRSDSTVSVHIVKDMALGEWENGLRKFLKGVVRSAKG